MKQINDERLGPWAREASYARARILLAIGGAGLAGVSSYLLYVLAGRAGDTNTLLPSSFFFLSFLAFSG
jgi:hypothetical protein